MLPDGSLVNFAFPNDTHIVWSLMIVIYPYITGLVAGAFVVSAFYHVFRIREFASIAHMALVAAFCFGLFAALPLLIHLSQPQRAFNIFFTPHLSSAMSIFGYVYAGYMVLLIVELWLTYRPHFVEKARTTTGIQCAIYRALMLGASCDTAASRRIDANLVRFLAAVGIPWACLLHGYVGFIFGSVKANAWWATPLQPLIFLMSAIVSGMAMLMLMYTVIIWYRKQSFDYVMIRKMAAYMWGFFIIDFTLEMLEVLYAAYENGHHWQVIKPLLSGPLFYPWVVGQVLILSVVPLFVLGIPVIFRVRDRVVLYLVNFAALLLVLQVLLMRFNVVVGGQMISKSSRGFVEYHFELLGKEGLLVAGILLTAPFVVYAIISALVPVLATPDKAAERREESPVAP
ncbi:MAG: NrfD/PsrC family molybdoenzyme membrane anchor subunit [Pseudomonadota bacterium]|nr:NrfD/PsrC family molybdoenzyme membrane anchor subunit [Pseudomonadota bacterium]